MPRQLPTLAVSVLLSAGLMGLTLALFEPFFTSDGAVMAMIASGTGLALRPDEHLVFTNVLVGRVVAALYRAAPDVPWYGLHLIGVQALAWVGVFYATLERGVTLRRVALCVLTYGVVGLGFVVNLQFSSTAFLAAAAGGCLWASEAFAPGARGRWAAAAAVGLMLLGSLVRFDPFLLAVAEAALVGALAGRRALTRRWLAIGLATLSLALAAQAYDTHYYRRDAGWRAFREFIPHLPQITDYGRAAVYDDALVPALQAIGWSENDHRLFMQWFHADPEVYSASSLERLLATAPDVGVRARLRSGVARLGRVVQNPALWAMLLALPCLLGAGVRRRDAAIVLGLVAAALGATILLAAFRKAAPQVYLPLFGLALCVALVSGGRVLSSAAAAPPSFRRRASTAAIALLAAAGLVLSIAVQHEEGRVEKERSRILRSRFAPFAEPSARLLVAWFNAFPFEIVRPLESTRHLRSLRLYSLGWSQRTPLAGEVVAAFGPADFVGALTGPRTVFLGPRSATHLLARYAEEHRAQRLRFEDLGTEPFTTFRAYLPEAGAVRE